MIDTGLFLEQRSSLWRRINQTKELESEKYEDSAEHVEIVNVLHNTTILYAKNVNIGGEMA